MKSIETLPRFRAVCVQEPACRDDVRIVFYQPQFYSLLVFFRREKIVAEREYKKKKNQKKKQRMKELEEVRETEKSKWQSFNTKVNCWLPDWVYTYVKAAVVWEYCLAHSSSLRQVKAKWRKVYLPPRIMRRARSAWGHAASAANLWPARAPYQNTAKACDWSVWLQIIRCI